MNTADAIQLVLLALVVGAALPLLVQLFSAVRTTRKMLESLSRRVDQTLDEVSSLATRVERASASGSTAATIGAALAPALVAAVQAFRHRSDTHAHHDEARAHHDGSEASAGARP